MLMRVVQVPRLDQVEARELFLGLGERVRRSPTACRPRTRTVVAVSIGWSASAATSTSARREVVPTRLALAIVDTACSFDPSR